MGAFVDDSKEYLEEIKASYPEALISLAAENMKDIEDLECVNYDNNTVTLFRGDSGSQLEDMGYNPESGEFEDGALTRDFPIYFTDNISDAEDYASKTRGPGRRYLIEIEVPFENLGDFSQYNESDIEHHFDKIDFNPPSVNYLLASNLDTDTEWISTEIPEEWVQNIEEI
jgi:hypothetical protein